MLSGERNEKGWRYLPHLHLLKLFSPEYCTDRYGFHCTFVPHRRISPLLAFWFSRVVHGRVYSRWPLPPACAYAAVPVIPRLFSATTYISAVPRTYALPARSPAYQPTCAPHRRIKQQLLPVFSPWTLFVDYAPVAAVLPQRWRGDLRIPTPTPSRARRALRNTDADYLLLKPLPFVYSLRVRVTLQHWPVFVRGGSRFYRRTFTLAVVHMVVYIRVMYRARLYCHYCLAEPCLPPSLRTPAPAFAYAAYIHADVHLACLPPPLLPPPRLPPSPPFRLPPTCRFIRRLFHLDDMARAAVGMVVA